MVIISAKIGVARECLQFNIVGGHLWALTMEDGSVLALCCK